jgi:hypothetical protein
VNRSGAKGGLGKKMKEAAGEWGERWAGEAVVKKERCVRVVEWGRGESRYM